MNSCAPAVSEHVSERTRRPRILIVEDEALVAGDLQQSLRSLGYDACATATSSREALEQTRSSHPDIVLMDIRLKGPKDGIATAKILQKELGPAIIYLTAHADEVTLERAKHTAPYGYLLKPVNEAALRSVVEITLYRREIDRAREEAAHLSASLQQSEERFRQLAENIQDVFFIVAADYSKLIYQSPAFEQIWGRPYDPSNTLDWTTSIHVDDYQRIMNQIAGHANEPVIEEFKFRIVKPGGVIRWIFARHFPLYDATGAPYRIVGVATDITERKLAEENIRQLNRVYAVLSGINALIIRAQTQSELFTGSCRLVVEQGDFTLAWIGWLEDGAALLRPLAWAGSDVVAGLLQEHDVVDIGDDAVATIGRREAWVCNDLDAMRPLFPYQRALLNHGVRSAVTLPLVMHGKTMGCLVLATNEREFYNDAEMRLLTELAGDIPFALDHIEKTEKLSYLAYFDLLTGLANRTLFLERLAQQVSAAKHNHTQFAVVVRDPDRFQSISSGGATLNWDWCFRQNSYRSWKRPG
jgi:PAS domain S-box-containing protein